MNKYEKLSKDELIELLLKQDAEANSGTKSDGSAQNIADVAVDSNKKQSSIKNKIRTILDNNKVNVFLIALILINTITFVLHTDADFNQKYGLYLHWIEVVSIVIFTIEYLMRVITIKKPKELFGFFMIIDLLAIAPFYLSFFTSNSGVLRILRLFRVIRILKLARYSVAIQNIGAALMKRKHELMITGAFFVLAVLLSSTLIHFAEKDTGVESFSSIISSFWWSVVTFTTVGYGDSYPITVLGKVVAGFSAIIGVAIHGLIIGIIGSAFFEIFKQDTKDE